MQSHAINHAQAAAVILEDLGLGLEGEQVHCDGSCSLVAAEDNSWSYSELCRTLHSIYATSSPVGPNLVG